MIRLNRQSYPYLEEVNEGVLKQFLDQRGREGVARPRVLDVGCGQASLGRAVRDLGYEVWGIEESPVAAKAAVSRLDRFIQGNLVDLQGIRSEVGEEKFDYLIFSDVLEHLFDPFSIVLQYREFLKPGGRVIISVPNIGAWEMRIRIFFGIFRYEDTGIMDRTHIRFFTFATTKEFVCAAGFKIERIDYTPYIVRALLPLIKRVILRETKSDGDQAADPRAMIDSPIYHFYDRWVYPIEYFIFSFWKSLFAFRIILVGRKE